MAKEYQENNKIKVGSSLDVIVELNQHLFSELTNKIFNIYLNPKGLKLCNKIESNNLKFNNYIKFSRGVEFGFKSENVFNEKIDETYTPILCGGNISKQLIDFEGKYVQHDENDRNIYKSKDIYEEEKILVKRIGNSIIGSYDNQRYYNVCDVYNLQLINQDDYNLISISAIINSKLINYFYDTKFKSVKKLFPKIPIQNLKLLPLPEFIEEIDAKLKEATIIYLNQNNELKNIRYNYVKYIESNYLPIVITRKLQNWHELEFGYFIKELTKAIKKAGGEKLTKLQEMDWMEVFEAKKAEAQKLKSEIDKTDKEIDTMVYKLYDLTEEEIQIVENS